jgi:hypothetical protein
MLFDLRGRGRRRTVQFIYMGLAVLMGSGLVLFGVGAGFGGGGILSSLSGNEGSGGTTYASEIKKYKKLTTEQPDNAAAWEKLTSAQLHEAGNEAYTTTSGVTSKGKELFAQVAASWESYIALNPPKPNVELAQRMVTVFSEEGLNQPAAAVRVLQLVVASRPTSTALFASLAEYAYKAHDTSVGDLASEKAVSLAPSTERARLKSELETLKKGGSGETLTTTTNGKTYTGKTGPNKTFTGSEVKTTTVTVPTKSTAPAGTTTTTKK